MMAATSAETASARPVISRRATFGALIFGVVQIGITYTNVNSDWFRVFLGGMLLVAVLFNNQVRKRVTEAR